MRFWKRRGSVSRMRTALVVATVLAAGTGSRSIEIFPTANRGRGRTSLGSRSRARRYTRAIRPRRPVIVLHGGPDFDHSYLVPDLDRLADAFRLIYYDQRGRGRSAEGVKPEDVTLASDIADLEEVRHHFRIDAVTLLGHSWGTVLALEYALRHPEHVSHLILMNPGPASADDYKAFRADRLQKLGDDLRRLRAAAATAAFKEGDPDAVAVYYRIHFAQGLVRPDDLEKVIASLRASFTKEGVLKARAIEDRLMTDTWSAEGYDLLPKLRNLRISNSGDLFRSRLHSGRDGSAHHRGDPQRADGHPEELWTLFAS